MFPNAPEALRTTYEDLRTQVFAGHRGPGLALFLRHGMREWLEVCGSPTTLAATMSTTEGSKNPQWVPPEMRSELVSVLAGLFLERRGEVHQ
jgi:hypothetical protein